MESALIGFAILFFFLFLGLPIAFGMSIVGYVGFALIVGWSPSAASVGQITVDSLTNYGMSVLPLFLLMGNFVNQAKLSEELYEASNAFVGHFRGGLSIATILACGGFSAVCGSSLATAATMARIAMPQMRRYGYADSLSAGSIATGGTLGILIPPSIILVIYGNLTETDIGQLFIAGIVPGLIAILLYILTVSVLTHIKPAMGPPGERYSMRQKLMALKSVWGVLALFIIVLGGIYVGIFTPTEAAGIGASGGFLFALVRKVLSVRELITVLTETAQMAGNLMVLLIGSSLFSNFINVAGMPQTLAAWIGELTISPIAVIICVMITYLILGCVFDGLSIMLLTVPVVFPLVQNLGFDLIWFGIILVVVIEVGLVTPPIGLNVFVLKSVLPELPTSVIFKGVTPFLLADFARLGIMVAFPSIVLFLPSFMQ